MPTLKQKLALLKQNLRLGLKDRKTAVWATILLALVITVSTLAIIGNGNTALFKGDIGSSQEITVAPLETYPSTTTAHSGDTNVDFGGFTLTTPAGSNFYVTELQLAINGDLNISNAKLIHNYPLETCGYRPEQSQSTPLTASQSPQTISIDPASSYQCRKHEFKIVADIGPNQTGGAIKVFKINNITTTPTSTFMPSLPFDLKKILTPQIIKATFIDIQSGGDDDINAAQYFSFFNNQRLNPGVTEIRPNENPPILAFLSLKQEQALNPASIKKLSFANKSSSNIDFSKIVLKVQAMTSVGGGEQPPTDAPFTPTHTGTSTDIAFTTPLSLATTGTTSIIVTISSFGAGFSPGDGNLIKLALENQTVDNCVGATPCGLQVTPNNGGNGLDFGKITIDKTPPAISDIKVENTSRTGVKISWKTNEPIQKGIINWGKKESLSSEKTIDNDDWLSFTKLSHSLDIDSLDANDSYDFKIKSLDTAGNPATPAVGTFMTGLPDFEVTDLILTPPFANISAGDQVTFSAKVKNRSRVAAPTSRGRFCVDSTTCLTVAGSRINEPSIPALTTNNPVTINSSNWEAKPGNHSVIFCANPTAVEGYEVINEAPYNEPDGDEGRGPENCKIISVTVKRAIRVWEPTLPEGQITNIPLESTQDIKFASIKFSEINKDANGTSTLKLKSFTLEYTGTFPFEKITSPAIAKKDSGRAMAASEVLVTKNNQLKNIIFDFKTPVAVGEAVEFITYAKANISQAEAGKKISYKVKYVELDPSTPATIKPNLETNPMLTTEIFTAALQLEACKAGETRSTPISPCACPANTYRYTGTASTPLFYQNPVGTVCVPCQQDQLTPVNGKLYCPNDKPAAPPNQPPPAPPQQTVICGPGTMKVGNECRLIPATPPTQNARSSATGTSTNVSAAQAAGASAREAAAAATARATATAAAAAADEKASAAAKAKAAAAAKAARAANSGAAGQQARASAATSGGTNLGGSQRIIRMPERGNTGPEALIYLGALPVLWGAWKLKKKLKR